MVDPDQVICILRQRSGQAVSAKKNEEDGQMTARTRWHVSRCCGNRMTNCVFYWSRVTLFTRALHLFPALIETVPSKNRPLKAQRFTLHGFLMPKWNHGAPSLLNMWQIPTTTSVFWCRPACCVSLILYDVMWLIHIQISSIRTLVFASQWRWAIYPSIHPNPVNLCGSLQSGGWTDLEWHWINLGSELSRLNFNPKK